VNKSLLVSLTVVTLLTGMTTAAWSQQSTTPTTTRIALVDMAHIFKNYEKFKNLREDLNTEFKASEEKAKGMALQIQNLTKQIKSPQIKEGGPVYVQKEKELIQLRSEFEAYRKNAQREFIRKESEIYKTVYLEVTDMVAAYAKHKNYTMVLRFDSTPVSERKQPQEILQGMNQQVVYFQESNDITKDVLHYLAERYKGQTAARSTGRKTN